MLRVYTFLCAFFFSLLLFADNIKGFVALEYGGNKTSYLIKNVRHVDVNSISANQAEMSVLMKDGVSMPNVRTLIFTDELLFKVQFVNYNGTVLQSSEVNIGETPKYTGTTPTKPATAEFTYTFAGWSPAITAVEGAQTYTATFKATKRKYTLTAKPEDDTMGTVTGSGTYDYGTKVTVKATKKYGYDFEKWDNGSTNNPLEITITGDLTLIAQFTVNKCEQLISPTIPELEVLPKAVWGSELYLEEADAAIKAAMNKNYTDEYAEIENSYWQIKIDTKWEDYTNQVIPNQPFVQVRYIITTICKKTVVGDAVVIQVERPTPENTKACKDAPSVNKYNWLLMLDVNSIKAQGYQFEESDITWYMVADNQEAKVVGTGYAYTIDQSLVGNGSYYAWIDLPVQTTNVGCKGILGTQVFDLSNQVQQRAMVIPSIVSPNQQVNVLNLPAEDAEIKVYDQVGKLYYILQSKGDAKVTFTSQELPGKYLVEIKTQQGKTILKYIVR